MEKNVEFPKKYLGTSIMTYWRGSAFKRRRKMAIVSKKKKNKKKTTKTIFFNRTQLRKAT